MGLPDTTVERVETWYLRVPLATPIVLSSLRIPHRDFVIRFRGGNSYARWKTVESIVLEDVPLSAREITLAVATDAGLNSERMEGSTRLALQGEETNLSVAVRFYNQFDKSVRFR